MSQQQQQGGQDQAGFNQNNLMNLFGSQGGVNLDTFESQSRGGDNSLESMMSQGNNVQGQQGLQNQNFMGNMARQQPPPQQSQQTPPTPQMAQQQQTTPDMSMFRQFMQNQPPQQPQSFQQQQQQQPQGQPGQSMPSAMQQNQQQSQPNIMSQLQFSPMTNPNLNNGVGNVGGSGAGGMMQMNNPNANRNGYMQGRPSSTSPSPQQGFSRKHQPELLSQLLQRVQAGQISSQQLQQIFNSMRTNEAKPDGSESSKSPMAPNMLSNSPSPSSQPSQSPNQAQSPSPTQSGIPHVGQKRKMETEQNSRKKPKKTDEEPSDNSGSEEQIIKNLLDDNFEIIQKIRQNLFQGHIRDNLDLITKFRDNIIRVLTCMSTMPGIMSQMPPIPVKLNTICMPSTQQQQQQQQNPNNTPNTPGSNPPNNSQ